MNWIEGVVSLLQTGALLYAALRLWNTVELFAPRPPQKPSLDAQVPMTPNAIDWVNSWPEGWEREQAEATLREQMQLLGDWDKAVARLNPLES